MKKKLKSALLPLNFLLLLFGMLLSGCHHKESASHFSESAEQALSTFELPPGFKIELIAADPLISDPVDMTIDEEGRMYVVEMHGYPLDLNHTGKVIMLRDTNGDGKMDTRTVFADSLVLPTGVMRWKKGILVTDPPNVYYMEDTTGDGKADIKKVMLTGFALTNPQYLVNRPIYGLDNWLYLAHEGIEETNIYPKKFGDTGSDIFYPDDPEGPRLPVNAEGRTVRFRPDVHALEETSSSTQFGQTFDDWGHHFLVSNANHIFQEVIANRYLKRNPDQLVGNATESLSDHGDACEVFPITKNPEHQLLTDVGVITSACGITDYQGGAFPDKFNHDITFVCEPVSNLVHVDHLKDNGATFTASRVLENKEFLASTDAWFRPVNMYIGPDGALYVVDYYREIIEHPEWMSESAVKAGNLYNGRDKGRIYRISASDAGPASWTSQLNLNDSTDVQLVEKLSNPNIWWRRNAQRLLVDRNHEIVVPELIKMAQNTQSSLGRLHALWTLEGMNKLTPELVMQALGDPEPGVRENAIKLAELHLDAWPDLVPKLLALKEDNNAKVRYQLLCTLGSINTPEASEARQELLFKDINDKWVQIAALSASSSQSVAMMEGILNKFDPNIPAYASLVERLATMIGASQNTKAIHPFLQKAVNPVPGAKSGWQASLLEGLSEGLKSRKSLPAGLGEEQDLLVKTCFNHPDVDVRKSARHILQVVGLPGGAQSQAIMKQAKHLAEDNALSPEKRAEAIHMLALQNPKQYASFLENLIKPDAPLAVQLSAMQALGTIPDATVSSFVLKQWMELTPGVRDAALNTFIVEPFNVQRIRLLLDAIKEGKIQKGALGWERTVILMRDIPDTLKELARSLLTNKDEDRKSVIQKYEAALKLKGDPANGKVIFQTNCIICHQVRGKMGVAFGPDLGTVHNWTSEGIMINILDPNLSISHGYDMWNVMLTNGTSKQGIISTETPNAIILSSEGGIKTTIARQNIKSLKTMGVSAMPVGFEKKINKQQMADLLSFLRAN
ncbi:MAG: c-type cytochrome [Bacteroidota bacterium]|nr:c-type cytochrome [Bacteroidota bacterium]